MAVREGHVLEPVISQTIMRWRPFAIISESQRMLFVEKRYYGWLPELVEILLPKSAGLAVKGNLNLLFNSGLLSCITQ